MAKKRHYAQNFKDRMHEHEGMEHGMRHREMYSGFDKAQKMMRADSGMIKEDRNAACFLPKHVIEKEWDQVYGRNYRIDADLYSGVEKQMKQDNHDFARAFKPGKA